ncbi:MAG: hypothetical protein P8X89_15805 [Reinekea sp.]
MINHNLLLQQHNVGANSLIKQRARVTKRLCNGSRFQALHRRLIGHLSFLAESQKDFDWTDKKRLVQNLCTFALTPAFHSDVTRTAAQLVEAHLFLAEQLDAVFDAIDITGHMVWQPVLQHIVQQQLLNDETICKLAARFSPLLEIPERLTLPAATALHPGQLTLLLRQSNADIDSLLQRATATENTNEFQQDLTWLALSLHKKGHEQTHSNLMHWFEIAPDSAWVYHAMIATGREAFTDALHQGVRNEVIEASALAFHGDAAHLSFCLELLESPRFNLPAAELWQLMTNKSLSQIPRLQAVDEQSTAKGKGEWVSVEEARSQLTQLNNATALWQGKPYSTQALSSWCLTAFGASCELALQSIWANSSVDCAILPNEPPVQRLAALGGAAV